jgi:hypothetical protein
MGVSTNIFYHAYNNPMVLGSLYMLDTNNMSLFRFLRSSNYLATVQYILGRLLVWISQRDSEIWYHDLFY